MENATSMVLQTVRTDIGTLATTCRTSEQGLFKLVMESHQQLQGAVNEIAALMQYAGSTQLQLLMQSHLQQMEALRQEAEQRAYQTAVLQQAYDQQLQAAMQRAPPAPTVTWHVASAETSSEAAKPMEIEGGNTQLQVELQKLDDVQVDDTSEDHAPPKSKKMRKRELSDDDDGAEEGATAKKRTRTTEKAPEKDKTEGRGRLAAARKELEEQENGGVVVQEDSSECRELVPAFLNTAEESNKTKQ